MLSRPDKLGFCDYAVIYKMYPREKYIRLARENTSFSGVNLFGVTTGLLSKYI